MDPVGRLLHEIGSALQARIEQSRPMLAAMFSPSVVYVLTRWSIRHGQLRVLGVYADLREAMRAAGSGERWQRHIDRWTLGPDADGYHYSLTPAPFRPRR